jgi:hypothetical protein
MKILEANQKNIEKARALMAEGKIKSFSNDGNFLILAEKPGEAVKSSTKKPPKSKDSKKSKKKDKK